MVILKKGIHRTKRENEYYLNECRKKGYHLWEQISRKGNNIEFQCKHCCILGHAKVRKYV